MTVTELEMSFDWFTWSNPVAVWWAFLLGVSVANIALWLLLHRHFQKRMPIFEAGIFRIELMVLLCAAYVFGCAFRSILPRADVQRIALFDTWLSSVFVGRSVATIAEVCFVIQWAIVLRQLGKVGEVGHGQQRLDDDRPADPDCGDLLVVRGDHHELPRQCDREFALGGDVHADRGRARAAAR